MKKSLNFYRHNTNLKWFILLVSVVIIFGSIFYTHWLVSHLKKRERNQVQLYSRALQYMVNESENDILFITEEIIGKNTAIPTILTDSLGQIISYNNIDIDLTLSEAEKSKKLTQELAKMKETYAPIKIVLHDPFTGETFGIQYVHYRNSQILAQLIAYPYVQLSILVIFGIISYLAFNYSHIAEQNRVWVGLTKETAHQLGTPLSSLMAWIEMLRADPQIQKQGIVEELNKDVSKLKIVAERFSSIGSIPVLKEENIVQVVNRVVNYIKPRVSRQISFEVIAFSPHTKAFIHAPLFEWVLENLCKNAVDAISEQGKVTLKIIQGNNSRVFIDVVDTGRGITSSSTLKVFKPGFTTKMRGWGLGLTLAKRIIEMYHKGRIYVRSSQEGVGTTFRIELFRSLSVNKSISLL